MTLDSEFKKQTEKLIIDTLSLYKNAGASPRISDVWKCENTGDFLCGFFVGEMVGSALVHFNCFIKESQRQKNTWRLLKSLRIIRMR